jgi:phosphatidylglycerophosphate synthase
MSKVESSLDHAPLTDRIREDCLEKEVANVLTLSRFPMLLIFILMIYFGNSTIQIGSVIFLFLALMIDTIDGPIARRTGKANLTRSLLDIAADRVYELILWVVFADLDVISITIPIIVITRTTLTDAIRSIGVGKGKAPFDQHETKLGKFIVGRNGCAQVTESPKLFRFVVSHWGLHWRDFRKELKRFNPHRQSWQHLM